MSTGPWQLTVLRLIRLPSRQLLVLKVRTSIRLVNFPPVLVTNTGGTVAEVAVKVTCSEAGFTRLKRRLFRAGWV